MFKKKEEDKTKSTERDIGFLEDSYELCKNLTSIEAHSFGSFTSSKDKKYLELAKQARKIRTEILLKITNSGEQSWCINKHMAESSMRLQELFTRYLSIDDEKNAERMSELAGQIYFMFLKLNGYTEGETNTKSSA